MISGIFTAAIVILVLISFPALLYLGFVILWFGLLAIAGAIGVIWNVICLPLTAPYFACVWVKHIFERGPKHAAK